MLPDFDDEALVELGILSKLHRKRILRAVSDLTNDGEEAGGEKVSGPKTEGNSAGGPSKKAKIETDQGTVVYMPKPGGKATNSPSESRKRTVSSSLSHDRPSQSQRIGRKEWATDEKWVNFRMNKAQTHIPMKIADMVNSGHLKSHSGDPSKTNLRKACMYCSFTRKDANNKLIKGSRFGGIGDEDNPVTVIGHAKKPYYACLECKVALCKKTPSTMGRFANKSCFERWHECRKLPE